LSATHNPGQLNGWRTGAGRPRGFDGNVQCIASAAHLRGVILMRVDQVVGSLEAAELCRTLRAAHENTRGDAHRHEHVAQLANGIALRLGSKGAVQVSRSAWNLLQGYARPRMAERPAGGSAAGRRRFGAPASKAAVPKRGPAPCRKDTGAQ
jgi:hypothetical protein